MARIVIADLPPAETIPQDELDQIFGAGPRQFRPSFESLEDRLLLSGVFRDSSVHNSPIRKDAAGATFGRNGVSVGDFWCFLKKGWTLCSRA
jgi:hypothetical protein